MAGLVLPELVDGDLRLRPPTEADLDAVILACQDRDIAVFTRVAWPFTRSEAAAWLAHAQRGLDNGDAARLVAVDARTDGLLGSIGLSIDWRDFSGEISYWVVHEQRGRGVATRGCRLLLRYAFDELDLGYIMLWSAADNDASNALAARLGFTLEGTARSSFLQGTAGDRTAPRGDAHLWGLRPGELR